MKRTVASVLAVGVLLTGLPARAEDHLVSLSAMQARLRQAAAQRDADLAEVLSVLASPAGGSAAAEVGLDGHALSAWVAVLSDADLRDVAQRATLLRTDPVAGGTGKIVLFIGILVLVILLIGFAVWYSQDAKT